MKAKTHPAPAKQQRANATKTRKKPGGHFGARRWSLFAEKGFYHTTTKAISRKAGIAEGTLFNYFETKEDLALYFFERELDEVIAWYERDRGSTRGPAGEAVCHHPSVPRSVGAV